MRRLTGLLVVLAFTFTTPLPAAPDKEPGAETKQQADYYPLKAGTKFHYLVKAGDKELKMLLQIAKIEEIDKMRLARLEIVKDGQVLASEHLSNTAQGLFRHRFNGVEMVPPVQLLKYPIKPGEAWKAESSLNKQKVAMTCKVGEEEVTVPLGKYKAITLRIDAEENGMKITTTYWFAPGIGPVKQTFDLGGQTFSLELEKYEAGK